MAPGHCDLGHQQSRSERHQQQLRVAKFGIASDFGSEGRGFKSHRWNKRCLVCQKDAYSNDSSILNPTQPGCAFPCTGRVVSSKATFQDDRAVKHLVERHQQLLSQASLW